MKPSLDKDGFVWFPIASNHTNRSHLERLVKDIVEFDNVYGPCLLKSIGNLVGGEVRPKRRSLLDWLFMRKPQWWIVWKINPNSETLKGLSK